MKNFILLIIVSASLILSFCTTTKNASGKVSTLSYTADVAPIIQDRCTPCHFPDTGKKKFLDTYQAAKENVDSILYRVQLPVSHPKFMPFKSKKEPLSDSLINIIKLWKEQDFPA